MALTSAQAASLLGNTVTTTNTYDDNISGLVNSILNAAQGEANAPYTPYTGQRIAGLNQDELKSDQTVRDNYLTTQPLYSQGTNLINQGTTGLNNLMTNQGTWNQNTASQYMSPYISNVINSTSEEALRNNQMALNQIRGNAAMSGAFGGSGDILAQTEAWNNNQRNLNSTIADLYNTGYNNAQTQFNADRDFGLKGVNQYNTQSEALQNLGANQQAALYKDTSALKTVGSNTRDIAQTNLNTAYSDWENQKDYNKNQLNWLQNLLTGASNANQATGSTRVTTPASTPGTSNLASSLLQGAGYVSNIANSDIGSWISSLFSTGGHVEAYAEGGSISEDDPWSADLNYGLSQVNQYKPDITNPQYVGAMSFVTSARSSTFVSDNTIDIG